jgi:hypothetical protein
MTFGKSALLGVGFVAAIGIGMGIGMSVAKRTPITAPGFEAYMSAPPSPVMTAKMPEEPAPESRTAARTPAARTTLTASAPEVQARLKPVLSKGTDVQKAAEGFRDARQFATLAHAARNTQVPFVVLKHHVLNEGKSLAAVIREFKPSLDATAEVNRARSEAAEDLAAIQN